jgi:hypothetical protein
VSASLGDNIKAPRDISNQATHGMAYPPRVMKFAAALSKNTDPEI